jgi:hypothetical protein
VIGLGSRRQAFPAPAAKDTVSVRLTSLHVATVSRGPNAVERETENVIGDDDF